MRLAHLFLEDGAAEIDRAAGWRALHGGEARARRCPQARCAGVGRARALARSWVAGRVLLYAGDRGEIQHQGQSPGLSPHPLLPATAGQRSQRLLQSLRPRWRPATAAASPAPATPFEDVAAFFKSGRFAPKIRSDRVSDRQVLSEPAQGPAALSRRCATGIARCRRWHSGTGTREDGCRAAGWPRGAACTAAVRASVVRRKYIRTRSQQAQRKTQLYTCDAHVLSIQRRGRDERGWAAHRRCPAAARSSARRRTPWAARRRRA